MFRAYDGTGLDPWLASERESEPGVLTQSDTATV